MLKWYHKWYVYMNNTQFLFEKRSAILSKYSGANTQDIFLLNLWFLAVVLTIKSFVLQIMCE
jgi:hypothetical protein